MIYRDLSFSGAPGCHRCSGSYAPGDTASRQRLRVFSALLQAEYAAQVKQLTITDVDTFCFCHSISNSLIVNSFARLCFEILIGLLPRAKNMRSLRSDRPSSRSNIADDF